MVAYTARKNPLMMQGGPAPGPVQDGSAEAYPMGTTAKASPMQQPPANPLSSVFMPQQRKPDAMYAFAETLERTLTPDAAKMRVEEEKTGQAEKLKQGLAFVKQLRALPMNQRYQMAQQGVQQFGLNVSLDPAGFTDEALAQSEAALSAQAGIGPQAQEFNFQSVGGGGLVRTSPDGSYETVIQPTAGEQKGPEIRQVGNKIVERQADGSWKPVFEGTNEAETARAFQGFIDANTGEQMVVMSDGRAQGTGRTAYIPPQLSNVGGVPVAVDKRTLATSELAPITDVAGNRAAVASAEVQGKAQGQAAFDLPALELRSQTAISSIDDLKKRNIGQRFGMQGKLYAIPGTDGADVQSVVRQVTSQAFLNAFDQLRGAGAITEVEGQAATAAITRLQDQNITVGEALKAMDELQAYYRKGIQVARQRAVKAPVLPGRPAGATGATRTRVGVPPLLAKPTPAAGVPDGVDPADWEFMTPEQKALFQ